MGDAAVTLLIRLAGAGLALGLQVLLARLMSAGDYGAFILAWTWTLALGSIASLGLAEVAVRLLPRYASRLRSGAVADFYRHGVRTVLLYAGGASIVGLALACAMPVSGHTRTIIAGISLGLPFLALEFFLEGVARAMGWFRLAPVAIYLVRPVLIAGAAVAAWLAAGPLTGMVACAILAGGLALTSLALHLVIQERVRLVASGAGTAPWGRGQPRFWMRLTPPVLAATGLDDALTYADVVLVGLLLSPAEAAIYFVASRILILANLVQYAFYFVAARGFSLHLAAGNAGEARRSMWQSTMLTAATTSVALLTTLAAAPALLAVFGPAYTAGFGLAVVLCLATLAKSVSVQAAEFMLVAGQTRMLMQINAAALVLLVAGTAAAVPVFGSTGAAASLATVMAARSAVLLVLLAWAPAQQPSRLGAAATVAA